MWTALPLEKSRSPATVNKLSKPRHNSRTKLCIELSLIHNRDNVELYLHCKFQSSPFSVRRKNGVTDRQNDRQRDYSMPRGSAHRGIMTDSTITEYLVSSALGIMTDRQHDYSMPRGSALGIMTDTTITVCLVAPPTEA